MTDTLTIPANLADRVGRRRIRLSRLHLQAQLGVLAHELQGPQPIEVNAELDLGPQRLLPQGDALAQVLDYRQMHEAIVQVCSSGHVNLLETLVGRIAQRLLQLPGVHGVHVEVTKLKIFDDCEVTVSALTGSYESK